MTDDEEQLLREQVRMLAAGMGLRYESLTAVIPLRVVDLAKDGKSIKAVQELRKATGAGLVEAKRIVDAIGAE